MSWIDDIRRWLFEQNARDEERAAEERRAIQRTAPIAGSAPHAGLVAGVGFAGGAGGSGASPHSIAFPGSFESLVNEHLLLLEGLGPWIARRGILLNRDENLGLPRRLYAVPFMRGSIKVLYVVNHSLEPDGSRKEYWLHAHQHAATAHEAVALSFGVNPKFYKESIAT